MPPTSCAPHWQLRLRLENVEADGPDHRAEDAPAPAVADERGVHLEASVHQIAVRRDPGRLDQVLDNLLSNALDVAPRGTAVRVSARPMGARVELEVRDSGPGMTPDQRARAFDRFWRSSGSRRTDRGFGLGLPIVRRLVLADGGDVRLEDAPAVGSPSWCPCPRRAPSSAPPPDALTD